MNIVKATTLAVVSACTATAGLAQTTAPTYLDAGRVRAPHYPSDDMWWNPGKSTYADGGIEFPKGDTSNVSGFASIQLSGINASGHLRVAANYDRLPGSDFQAGPAIAGDSATMARNANAWSKVWKITSAAIDSFLSSRAAGRNVIPASILDWPAKGNTNALDAAGAALVLTEDLAPFVDVNGDGIYNPATGDYPKMKGSEMLWWVLNDRKLHPRSQTAPIDIQVAVCAYAYTTGTTADNMIFYEYDLLNRGSTLSPFQFASVHNFDLGYAFNDNIGLDSARRVILAYNANSDITGPARNAGAAVVLLEQPGDSYISRLPVRNMESYSVQSTTNGTAISQELAARQLPPLRPWNKGLDYGCMAQWPPADQNGRIAAEAITLRVNEHARYAIAMMIIDSIGICNAPDFSRVTPTVDTAYYRYWHPSRVTPPANPAGVPGSATFSARVYPNPVSGALHVESANRMAGFDVINALGAAQELPCRNSGTSLEIQTAALPPGIYLLRIRPASGGAPFTTTFIHN